MRKICAKAKVAEDPPHEAEGKERFHGDTPKERGACVDLGGISFFASLDPLQFPCFNTCGVFRFVFLSRGLSVFYLPTACVRFLLAGWRRLLRILLSGLDGI